MFTENLLELRRQRRLSQQALANKAGISLVAYRNIETGESEPKAETLRNLAVALGVSMRELFIQNQPLEAVRFRALKKMKRRAQVLSDVKRWLADFNDIENTLNDPNPYSLDSLAHELAIKPKGKERALFAADHSRHLLNLEKEPIRDICGLLESVGIKVYPLALESEGFFGLSVAQSDGGPAIVVNVWDRISVERWIFSAVHELGHLLLHLDAFHVAQDIEDNDEEHEADWFASYFLMPKEAFEKKWQETHGLPGIDQVLKVKRYFGVSYRTILRRLIDDYRQPDTLWRDFHGAFLRAGKPLRGHLEPRALAPLNNWDFAENRLRRLVRKGIEDEKITMSRGAEILGIKIIKMREIAASWAA